MDYSTDVTDKQWKFIRKMLPKKARRGRPPIDRRAIINAILYITRAGCQWRMMPKNFPNWSTVYGIFRKWTMDGTWQKIHDKLREKARIMTGKKPTPTAAIVDSQSIRTAEGGEHRGYDAGKKITGRKRHIIVDTLGLILGVVVHGADVQDQEGVWPLLEMIRGKFRRLKVLFGDVAYGRNDLPDWVLGTSGWVLQTVLRPVGMKGFTVLPKRWIVERTFSWLARNRRHSRDYEKTTASSESFIYIAMIHLMLKRLEKAENEF
jgi:putative transposase